MNEEEILIDIELPVEEIKVQEVSPVEVTKVKNKKTNHSFKYFLVFILGIAFTLGIVYYFKDDIFPSFNSGQCYTKCENKVTIDEKGISESVDKIYDAVVYVENYKKQKLYATGTGFVYKVDQNNGYIITNYHVINGSDTLKVILSNDKMVDATYLGGDEYMDIAIIAIKAENVIKVAELGDSSLAKLGDTVFTVGTPVDYEYRGTVTRGILSGKDRMVEVENTIMKVLQTDAAINPGNSGGPLVNTNGEVIGVNSLKLATKDIEGMGFAIAIEEIKDYLTMFEKGEKLQRPYIGVNLAEVTDAYSLVQSGITLDKKITKGVVVIAVIKNSPAEGVLVKGDVITKINGIETSSLAFLRHELFKYKVGNKINITYIRNGKEFTSKLTLQKNSD